MNYLILYGDIFEEKLKLIEEDMNIVFDGIQYIEADVNELARIWTGGAALHWCRRLTQLMKDIDDDYRKLLVLAQEVLCKGNTIADAARKVAKEFGR